MVFAVFHKLPYITFTVIGLYYIYFKPSVTICKYCKY